MHCLSFAARLRPTLAAAALVGWGALLAAGCDDTSDGGASDSMAADTDADGGDTATDPADVARMATGTIAGTDIYVATVVEPSKVITYFCGGDETFQTRTQWFTGAPGEAGEFAFELNGWQVTGVADQSGASGSATTPDNAPIEFTTVATAEGAAAGLYRALDGNCTAGVIVVDNGGTLDAQGSYFCPDSDAFVQVIILNPGQLTSAGNGDGIEVQVQVGEETKMLVAQRV